jgi:integrase
VQDAETLIAAIHRDWGEAQGNYDELRLFTGMRPSEEIALVLSDLDLVNGIVSINKARVAGVDRCQTKTVTTAELRCARARWPFSSGNSPCEHDLKLAASSDTSTCSSVKRVRRSGTCRSKQGDGARP